MERPINKSTDAMENGSFASVRALSVVMALLFTLHFAVWAAVPEFPAHVHRALVDLPLVSERVADEVVDASVNASGPAYCLLAFLHAAQRSIRRGQG